jgi:dihydroorotase
MEMVFVVIFVIYSRRNIHSKICKMNLIIRNAKIIDSKSPHHNQIVDIKIEKGIIAQIAKKIPVATGFKELLLENLHLSQGWFDSSVCFAEPGFEESETITNGLIVAAKSGFTGVALQPNTAPVTDNQAQINFVSSKAKNSATNLYPIGALTKNSDGKDLAELFDMKNAGAIAFGDYNKNNNNANVLKIGLQYTQDFDGLVIAFCENQDVKGAGVANEGVISTKLGLKGNPSLAEEIEVARNLFLLEYTGGKLHIPTLSSGKSAELIKEAKKKGLHVTCSVAVHHLVLTDEALSNFDSNSKIIPPLRDEANRKALVKAVKEGVIDMITSDHHPIDIEHKKMEFDYAKSGTIGLESAFGALQNVLSTEVIIEKLTAGKSVFTIENHGIKEKDSANFTFFNPEKNWTFEETAILSKSKNSVFLGSKMKGIVYGIFNNNQLILND